MLGDNAKWCRSLDNGIQAQVTISMCRNRLGPTIIIPQASMENGGSFVWRILCRSGIQQILWMSNGSLIRKFPTLESHFSEISKPDKQFFFRQHGLYTYTLYNMYIFQKRIKLKCTLGSQWAPGPSNCNHVATDCCVFAGYSEPVSEPTFGCLSHIWE